MVMKNSYDGFYEDPDEVFDLIDAHTNQTFMDETIGVCCPNCKVWFRTYPDVPMREIIECPSCYELIPEDEILIGE